MRRVLDRFFSDENGAVTVDWVVLTAAVVGLSAIGFEIIEQNAFSLMESAASAVDAEDDFAANP